MDIFIKDEGNPQKLVFTSPKAIEYYDKHLRGKFENQAITSENRVFFATNAMLRILLAQFKQFDLQVESEVDITPKVPEFSLKKIKYHADMSEETPAFSAEIWQGGKKLAYVMNTGQGGCNSITPAKGYTYKDVEIFDNLEVECTIFQLVELQDTVKRLQPRAFVIMDEKGGIYTSPLPKGFKTIAQLKKNFEYPQWIKSKTKSFKAQGYKLLNTNI